MKSIQIKIQNWEYLQKLKIKNNMKSLDEVLDILLTHTKEAIKRGDLTIIKNG